MRIMQIRKYIIDTYYHLFCNVMFKIKMKTKTLNTLPKTLSVRHRCKRRAYYLSRAPLNSSRRNRYSIWNCEIKLCFLIQNQFDHALTIHENTFNHVKEKFTYIHLNDFLVRPGITESRCGDFLENLMCPCKDITWEKHRVG